MELKVKRIHESAKLPSYGHKGDAGLDLYSSVSCVLTGGEVKAIATGIQVEIPAGYVGLIWDKSGVSLKGVGVNFGRLGITLTLELLAFLISLG